MNWIRCNNCFTRADLAKDPFALTKCGHMYCSRCRSAAERQCPICNTNNVPMIRLEEPLDPTVASFFTPAWDQMQQLHQVSDFQAEQLRIVMKRFNELDSKYVYCKEVCRKLEMGTAKLDKKFRKEKEELMVKLRSLENANNQLRVALDRAENRPYGNYRSAQSSSSSLQNPHTCSKRFQKNISRVAFHTPLSVSTNSVGPGSSNSDRKYISSSAEPHGIFRIPNTSKLPRSAGTKSSTSTVSTPSNLIPGYLHLDSMRIARS